MALSGAIIFPSSPFLYPPSFILFYFTVFPGGEALSDKAHATVLQTHSILQIEEPDI